MKKVVGLGAMLFGQSITHAAQKKSDHAIAAR